MSTEIEQQPLRQEQPKKEHIEWRRARVLELSSQGRTEREIAAILKVSAGTVARDLSFIHKEARDNMRYHISERLPAQYLKCQNGLDQVLKMAWNIIIIDSINQQTKLQALSLISDCYKNQMDLTTNSSVITDAIKHITQMQNNLNIINRCDKSLEESEAFDDEATTNGVF